ncbi:carboxypeptidase-like regulatory domain-containing protein [Agromyces subbeticus]|uniref:carboxypeptidase-like regulatory domain-containing protein n=1 Tax=Agromyces subbeticus TaxID=293890 RepID=UPI0003B7112B|nr:carboxypeptidase-like regulatory domain-containing protein [Agromyces subbeticus]
MLRGNRTLLTALTGLMAAALTVTIAATPASAATTANWATWAPLTGSGGAYATSMTLAGQPALTAQVSSDSRGAAAVVSGASMWLSEGTPVGEKYGSSRDQPYLNLRPKADSATAPSTTTYSFASPTPTSGWTFVLGDIDADQVRIQAIGADGAPLTATELGFREGFNYCADGVVGKPSCDGDALDVPEWDPAAMTLTGNDAAEDTSGAAAWFEPQTSISSLTFVFTRRAGFPVYQTWFASLARDITGTVTDAGTGPADGVTVNLIDANGDIVGTTTTAGGGLYSFEGFFATDGYIVEAVLPAGKIAVDANRKPADLTTDDAVVDFSIRDIVPVAVSGTVTDADNNPMPGVEVTIGGVTRTTDSNGNYLFDEVPVGSHTATIQTPDGYSLETDPLPSFTIEVGDTEPITGIDFVVAANPTLSGTVTAAGTGVPGVTVTAEGPDGTLSTVTGADGTYSFPLLPSGEYTVTVTAPDGTSVVGSPTRAETVTDGDVENVDFELVRFGSIEGTVFLDDGTPFPAATVTVSGAGDSSVLTTDATGGYALGTLPPGEYTMTLTVPAGYTAVGPATRTVTITAAGEAIFDQDFVLLADTPAPTPTPTPTPGGSGTAPAGTLPATGVDPATGTIAIASLLAALAGAALVAVTARRRRVTG